MRKYTVKLRRWLSEHRSLIGKFAFEFVIIVIGVTAAFALEGIRQDAEDARYRDSMIAALRPTLDNVTRHNAQLDAKVGEALVDFDAALARGEKPMPPIYREDDSERPPTRAWDAIVATGAAKSLDPKLLFDLSLFYTRQDSYGERYIRYNDFTESRVLALGPGPAGFYDAASGRLKPEFAAHIDRLREMQRLARRQSVEARKLRAALEKFAR